MNEPKRTQKQLGQQYLGNLRYFKLQSLPLRMRFYLSMLAVLLTATVIAWTEGHRTEKIYNPAPLSVSHVFLEGNCEACHTGRLPDFHSIPFSGEAAGINLSCQKCHANKEYHQPSVQTLALARFRNQMKIAGCSGCFSCHQEHLGRVAMQLPGDATCASCHNDAAAMALNAIAITLSATNAALGANAIHATTADGLVHFLAPQQQSLPLFASFVSGHPSFDYEKAGLRDPDTLQFDHQLHLTGKTVLLNGRQLDCNYCHKADADGVYYRRVTYEVGCKDCHSLNFDPQNPKLMIPHGNVERVRLFLHSLPFQYQQIAAGKFTSPDDQRSYVLKQLLTLRQRTSKGEDFEHEIFFAKNPYRDPGQGFFPGCAYCHEVKDSAKGAMVTAPSMADRWLSHGMFTHAKHVALSCTACHDALHSQDVADIVMPPKQSCAACHMPQGQASSACLTCHTFHTPLEAVPAVRQLLTRAEPKP